MHKHAEKKGSTSYAPIMDWWVAGFTLLVIAVLSASIPVLINATIPGYQIALGVLGVLAFIAYIADTIFFTYYQLDDEGLTVSTQLKHFHVAYREMREIRPIGFRALITNRKRKRFALSTKAVELKITDHHWPAITLSPHDRESFLNHLLEHIDIERSSRATIERKKK